MNNFENMKYMINTYGCQMNVHDSEKIAGMLDSLGMKPTLVKEEANYIVFNTCCIREGAEDKAYSNICALKSLKTKKPSLRIILCGCMPQQKEGKYDLREKLNFVDIIIGTHNINQLKSYIIRNALEGNRIYEIHNFPVSTAEILHNIRDDKYNAYVNIIYGCNNFCTYCIVPYVRGRERSRPINEIVKEVTGLVQAGYKYITLLGQNVNSYGNDLADRNATFPNLLKILSNIKGSFKIKFMTSHPKDFSDELIDVISSSKNISKAIHLPVQSGSNRILHDMNRKYTRQHYLKIVKKLRKKIKNVAISTDIIAGFPGETEKDFKDTISLLKKAKFSNIFSFIYSRRTGTPAAGYEKQIPHDIKNYRCNEIFKAQKKLVKSINKTFLHKNFRALIRFDENNELIAETDFGKPICISNQPSQQVPYFAIVNLTHVKDNKYYGNIKKEDE